MSLRPGVGLRSAADVSLHVWMGLGSGRNGLPAVTLARRSSANSGRCSGLVWGRTFGDRDCRSGVPRISQNPMRCSISAFTAEKLRNTAPGRKL